MRAVYPVVRFRWNDLKKMKEDGLFAASEETHRMNAFIKDNAVRKCIHVKKYCLSGFSGCYEKLNTAISLPAADKQRGDQRATGAERR